MTVTTKRPTPQNPAVRAKTNEPSAKDAPSAAQSESGTKAPKGEAPTQSANDAKVDAAIQTATRQLTQVLSQMVAKSIAKHVQGGQPQEATTGKVATGINGTKASSTTQPALVRGDRGPRVAALQQELNANGAKLAVDGKYGPKTEAAVQAQQKETGAKSTTTAPAAANAPPVARGQRGPRVAALQQALNGKGAQLKVDGNFGEKTEAAVKAFQNESGKSATGVVDGEMAQQLKLPPPQKGETVAASKNGRASGPFARTSAGRAQQAEALLQQNGVQLREGKSYVVQIDQDTPPSSASAKDKLGHIRSYTGETSVFRAQGGRLVEVAGPFKSASHPGQTGTRRQSFTDVNRDGKDDIPHLRSGAYEYNKSTNYRGRFNPKSDKAMKVARDLNHDGAISAREDKYALDRNLNGTGMQWHAGLSNRPRSVGCQTMAPADYKKFTRAVQQGNGNAFTYVLARRPNERFGANPL